MEKPNKFHIFVTITCIYAVFLFYLSSLSTTPEPPAPGFLYEFARQLEAWGLQFIMYPLYYAYKYPDKFVHVLLYLGFGLLLNLTLKRAKSSRMSNRAFSYSYRHDLCYYRRISSIFRALPNRKCSGPVRRFLGVASCTTLAYILFWHKKSRKLQHKKRYKICV